MTLTQALPKTTLSPLALLAYLQEYVACVGPVVPRADPDCLTRAYSLLELSDDLEIWAIHWPTDQGLELHDHGGSTGALVVVEGSLDEHVPDADGRLSRRSIEAGSGAAFGPTYVHDVVNRSTTPATSLHAYSPPMASMTFYRAAASGLVVDRTEYRADPAWAP